MSGEKKDEFFDKSNSSRRNIRVVHSYIRLSKSPEFGWFQLCFLFADCGSGIGRITKNLLIRYFNEVGLVQFFFVCFLPCPCFTDIIRRGISFYSAAQIILI